MNSNTTKPIQSPSEFLPYAGSKGALPLDSSGEKGDSMLIYLDDLDYQHEQPAIMIWKLAEAKNKLSEVVRRALDGEPQRIERREDAVVVVAADEFDRLTGGREGLYDYLLNAPDLSELELERDRSPMRDLEL